MEDRDGYRMKFACYYPRVEYGQCPSASILLGTSSWGLPAPPPPPPVSSLLCSDCLPLSCPPRPPGFQVKVLREDGRAAFRLFETKIIQALHFSRKEKWAGRRAGECGG